jgi:Bacterial Ig-like domain (group 3)
LDAHDHAGRTTATASVAVTAEDGLPATGSVVLSDHGRQLAGAALNKQGQATLVLDLRAGAHSLAATYSGDATRSVSVSPSASVQAQASTTPDFGVTVAPATLTLTPGQSGNVTPSITPENASGLTAPMFVTLSCSGLPDESSCTFNPANIEILPNATAPITSSMVILTQAASFASLGHPRNNGLALAILLPGALGLGGLAFSMRRRRWLQRLSLLALVALVSTLGTTACNARYDYYHHGPPLNPATPAGTYTVDVTAQSSNGVTATTHTTTLALTVQ